MKLYELELTENLGNGLAEASRLYGRSETTLTKEARAKAKAGVTARVFRCEMESAGGLATHTLAMLNGERAPRRVCMVFGSMPIDELERVVVDDADLPDALQAQEE